MSQAPEDDNPWDAQPAGQTQESAFSEPHVLDADVSTDHDGSHYDESASFSQEDVTAKPKSKPNVAILALAGLLGLGVLGGAGYVAQQKLFAKKPVRERMAVIDPVDLPPATAATPNVFDAPAAPVASNVFDPAAKPTATQSAPEMAAVSPAAAASAVVVAAPAAPVTPAATVAAPVTAVKEPVAVRASEPAPTAPAVEAKTAAAVASVADKVEKPAAAVVPARREVVVEKPAEPTQPARAKRVARASAKPAPQTAAASKPDTQKPRRVASRTAKNAKKTAVASAERKETFLLPGGMKVQGIFPQSGPNVQAWVADGSGRTEVVRVGDTLRSGAQVTQIVAEKGQVITTSGVITTRGVQ